jgi:GT2 family glycosyltransferase
VSVVVCAYNAADTIGDCLASLDRLTYPDVEVLVINDGSRDGTGEIARRHRGVRVIDIPNGGLSAARNHGLAMASGEIVAYTDADARVDPDWLTYLVQPLLTSEFVAAGGPNVVPPDDPWVAQCVARAPGGPTHVLLDDRTAEHVPGCNMAFRRDALLSIGGFDPVYRRAGDDVDVCWRLQAHGARIGFAPAALVWHHHRPTVRAYWRQQVGYGEGQAWLVPRHPEKFRGQTIAWRGSIYSPLPSVKSITRSRVNTGVWGTAAFPSVYETPASPLTRLPHRARWQIASLVCIVGGLLGAFAAGPVWGLATAAGAVACLITVAQCIRYALASNLDSIPPLGRCSMRTSRAVYRTLIAWLHVIQPFAHAWGRVRGSMSLPPAVGPDRDRMPRHCRPSLADAARTVAMVARGAVESRFWSERWVGPEALLTSMTDRFRRSAPSGAVRIDDGWEGERDIDILVGLWGRLEVRVLVEEHDGGRCLVRVAHRIRPGRYLLAAVTGSVGLPLVSAYGGALTPVWPAGALACGAALGFLSAALWRAASTVAAAMSATAALTSELGMLPMPGRPFGNHRWRRRGNGRPGITPGAEAAVPLHVVGPLVDTETSGT